MKVLLVYPPTPDTFWSFKHVLRFVSKRAAFPPLGLLTVAAMLPAHWQLKLVGFTRTYFEMYFTEQYQKGSFEMDPVMNIRFPRAFAAGKREYQGHTYHFYTKESLQAFENAPSEYVEATKS